MKITVDVQSLSRELARFQGILPAKSTHPSTPYVLLEAHADEGLRLTATDLDIYLQAHLPCEVAKEGAVALRGKELYEAIRGLRDDIITLDREANFYVQMTSTSLRARLIGLDPIELPRMPSIGALDFISVPTLPLLRMVDRTLFSVASDESRPNLLGGLLQFEDDKVRLVSTDGHRLSKAESRIRIGPDALTDTLRKGIIVPRKALGELRRIVDLTLPSVNVALLNNNLVLRFGNSTFIARLIDGSFPNFSSVMPEERPERRAFLPRKDFLERLQYAKLFSSARTGNVRLALEGEVCTISAQDPDKGESEQTLMMRYAGEPVRAGFNVRYLIDALSAIEGEEVSIEVRDSLAPAIVREMEGDEGDEAIFIVMPMRL